VEGLYVFYDFIDEAEEQRLLAAVKDEPWNTLPRRRVQHWGYEFDYKTRNIDITKPLGAYSPSFARVSCACVCAVTWRVRLCVCVCEIQPC
jgi:alkylated DNA repair protein alkB family protein 8